MSDADELVQRLFRTEFSKMVAVISKLYGLEHIELAEDIVSETFLQATQSWNKKGGPPNPAAWLYHVARQKTWYHFRRNKIFFGKVAPALQQTTQIQHEIPEPDFSAQNILDSQLQMMFAICDPAIASEAQIGLALRILCGFGIDEIAEAFISNKETINKRLHRAKEKLRAEKITLVLPAEDKLGTRLNNVLRIIYLLFNEGYYSTTQNQALRKDLCLEALRLGMLLIDYDKTNIPATNALVALMCFHTSRLPARENSNHDMILYDDQDEILWNTELIEQGNRFLEMSAQGNEISSYHLEAGIAFWHCQKEDTKEKWEAILYHYNLLLQINYSPAVALNRLYALYKAKGAAPALAETEKLQLTGNHFYFTLQGELYKDTDTGKAKIAYEKAFALAKTPADKQTIQAKIKNL